MMSRQDENSGRQLTKNQHLLALFLAGFPLGLGLIISMFHATYFIQLLDSSVQPLGWMMLAGILLLVGAAYVALLGSFALSNGLEPPRWLMTKASLRLILVVGVIVLFVLPATLLVLLGPAILLFVE